MTVLSDVLYQFAIANNLIVIPDFIKLHLQHGCLEMTLVISLQRGELLISV